MAKLTDKMKMFCKEYIIDLNATQAAIRAGYSKSTANRIGSENLTKPDIQEEIQRLMSKRENKLEISAEYVLNNIIEIGERCMERIPVMVRDGKTWKQKEEYVENPETGKKEWVGVWEFKENGALKAQELLGKHLKLFVDQSEVKHTGEIKHTITKIDLDERIKKVDTYC